MKALAMAFVGVIAVLGKLVEMMTDPQLLMATLTTLAVFGLAASLIQSVWTMLRLVLIQRMGMAEAARRVLPWWLIALSCGLLARILWVDYLAVFQPGPALTEVLTLRSAALKLILVGFLKSVLVAGIVVALFPVLWLARQRISHPTLDAFEGLWRRHAPKAAPYLIYYALLMVIVSLATDHEVLARLPDVELEVLARNVQEDVIEQIVEMRGVLLRLFDFSG